MNDTKNILSDLKNKIYAPVYFLYGTEALYIDQVTNFIEKKVLNESEKSFNQTVLYGREVEAINIIEVCMRLPMMSSYQVVIVKEAQDIKGFEKLEKYFKNPVKSTILVLAYKHKKVDKRKVIFKNIIKNKDFVILESNTIREYEVEKWIASYVKSKKISINPTGVKLLAEFLGTDLSKITHEIDKLILVKGEKSEITEDDIEKNIGISKEYNIFELTNALGKKDNLKCFKITNYFVSNPKSLFLPMALGTIYNFFTKLFLTKYAANFDNNSLSRVLKIHPFIAKDYKVYASKYDIRQINNVFSLLRTYDLKSKGMGATGSMSQGELLRELIAKILN